MQGESHPQPTESRAHTCWEGLPACVPVPSALLRIITKLVAFAFARKADADPEEDHGALDGREELCGSTGGTSIQAVPAPNSLGISSALSSARGHK